MLVGEIGRIVGCAHQFDEADGHRTAADKLGEVGEAVLQAVAEQHRVDLHRRDPDGERLVEAGHHLIKTVVAGQASKGLGVQAIDGDVEIGQARGAPAGHVAVQVPAVGGHGDLGDPGDFSDPGDDLADVLAHRGFAPGEPHLLDPEPLEGGDQPADLLDAEEGGARGLPVAVGQAVGAAEIAHLGHREAQVAEAAAEPVDQGLHGDRFLARQKRRRFPGAPRPGGSPVSTSPKPTPEGGLASRATGGSRMSLGGWARPGYDG